mmetsp:Transcript_93054/g.170756  ORF Transcript_93054/g.170756 Transcript_93054/m.170756 type:complete len:259 (+) Transcript_93054:85-861(+)
MAAKVEGTVLVLGLPGKGKSTFLNTISTGKPDSEMFPAGRSVRAVTKEITFKTIVVEVPGETPMNLGVYDVPGLFDGKIKTEEWQKMFKEKLLGQVIDLIFLVVSAHDRVDVGNTMIAVAVPFFFQELTANRVCLVMTHCDQVDVEKSFIKEWESELAECAKGKVAGSGIRFDKKRASDGAPGFCGKKPHADEVRRDLMGLVRASRLGTTEGFLINAGKKPVAIEANPEKMYRKLAETIDPIVLEEAGVTPTCGCSIS